jgi:acyl-CoA thioesterase-1
MLRGFCIRAWTLLLAGSALAGCTADTPQPAGGADASVDTAGEPIRGALSESADATTSGPRVVFLGTSLTAGLGLRLPDERWPERLGWMADSASLAFEVVNAGRSGDTSAGGLARLDWILREPVDILVLELGANDGLRGLPIEALEDNLATIIERTREAWPDVRILVAGMEAPTNLGPQYTARFREVFSAVAAEEDVTLVPFLLDGVAGVPELNQADRIHPTAEGHDRMARTVWPYLQPLLAETIGSGP